MRVLIHTDEYYPTAQACSFRMQVLANAFIKDGDNVTVITSSCNSGNIINNRKERIIYSWAIKLRKKNKLLRLLNNLSFAFTSIISSFRVGKVDVVITTSPPPLISVSGWIIAKLKRASLIYDVRDIWPDVAVQMKSMKINSFYYYVFKKICNFMYKRSDIITTVTSGKYKKIKSYLKNDLKINYDKVWLVENGFDEDINNSKIDNKIIKKYKVDKIFTCVYIGNIGMAQGLDKLLEVAKRTKHKNIQFLIYGTGALKDRLEKICKKDGINSIKFCGVLDHSKVYSIISKSKISFISLKTGDMKDSIPTKIYESLGLGCPVFLVANGDATSLIDETKYGVYVMPEDIDGVVKAFDEMVDDYDSYLIFKDAATKLMVDKHSRQKISAKFVKIIKNKIK